MKAMVQEVYGVPQDVLRLRDVDPVATYRLADAAAALAHVAAGHAHGKTIVTP